MAERRADPTNPAGTRKTYTRDQFTEFYGKKHGAEMWKQGGSKGDAGAEERRRDPTNPPEAKKAYTRAQFTEFYGKADGAKMWNRAPKENAPKKSDAKKDRAPREKKEKKAPAADKKPAEPKPKPKIITHKGLPNSTPIEVYLKVRGLTDKYDWEEVNVLPSDGLKTGQVRGELQTRVPQGAIPALELGDGKVIEQSNALLAFFEARHPHGKLEGTSPEDVATNRMWNDRIEKSITEFGLDAFRTGPGKDLFAERYPCYAEANKCFLDRIAHFMKALDKDAPKTGLLGGEKPNIADIRMYCSFEFMLSPDFGSVMGSNLEDNANVRALFGRQKELFTK